MSWFWNVRNKFVKNFLNLVLELDLDPKQVTFTINYRKFTVWYNGKKKKIAVADFILFGTLNKWKLSKLVYHVSVLHLILASSLWSNDPGMLSGIFSFWVAQKYSNLVAVNSFPKHRKCSSSVTEVTNDTIKKDMLQLH